MAEASAGGRDPASPRFERLRDVLLADQTLRTWSILVAIFGDLAPSDGDALSGRALGVILMTIGVRPSALRVALHRLRRDNWIESERVGRESVHRLAPRGLEETRKATPVIYNFGPRAERTFLHICAPDQEPTGYRISAQMGLSTAPVTSGGGLTFAPDDLPDWMRAAVCPPDLEAGTADFAERLSRMSKASPYDDLSLVERATLRVLIIQGWRRIALRTPSLSDDAFPVTWRGRDCRRLVSDLLADLPRPDLDDIESTSRTMD